MSPHHRHPIPALALAPLFFHACLSGLNESPDSTVLEAVSKLCSTDVDGILTCSSASDASARRKIKSELRSKRVDLDTARPAFLQANDRILQESKAFVETPLQEKIREAANVLASMNPISLRHRLYRHVVDAAKRLLFPDVEELSEDQKEQLGPLVAKADLIIAGAQNEGAAMGQPLKAEVDAQGFASQHASLAGLTDSVEHKLPEVLPQVVRKYLHIPKKRTNGLSAAPDAQDYKGLEDILHDDRDFLTLFAAYVRAEARWFALLKFVDLRNAKLEALWSSCTALPTTSPSFPDFGMHKLSDQERVFAEVIDCAGEFQSFALMSELESIQGSIDWVKTAITAVRVAEGRCAALQKSLDDAMDSCRLEASAGFE